MISDFCKLFISSQDKNLISLAIENFFKSPLINGKYIETEMLDIYFFNNDEFEAGQTTVYIFCTISHISFVIGVFYSDKVKKILDRIKFKRKK